MNSIITRIFRGRDTHVNKNAGSSYFFFAGHIIIDLSRLIC